VPSSFTHRTHSSRDFEVVFNKMNFEKIKQDEYATYYQNPDGAIVILQNSNYLDQPYIDLKLDEIGISYKAFVWLCAGT
jgi:hypothetical protein